MYLLGSILFHYRPLILVVRRIILIGIVIATRSKIEWIVEKLYEKQMASDTRRDEKRVASWKVIFRINDRTLPIAISHGKFGISSLNVITNYLTQLRPFSFETSVSRFADPCLLYTELAVPAKEFLRFPRLARFQKSHFNYAIIPTSQRML